MTTTSSWSLPMADCPLETSSPTTSHENCRIRIESPTGLREPKSSRRTVSPITQTVFPPRSSASLKARPEAIFQFPARK